MKDFFNTFYFFIKNNYTMRCSLCHAEGHRITKCNSDILLRLMRQLKRVVEDLKRQPLTNVNSNAMKLHTHICDLDFNEIKGAAVKLDISITGKRKDCLIMCVVKELWFRDPEYVISLCDLLYLEHLDRMIAGMDSIASRREYDRSMNENNTIILDQMREFNINRMISMSGFYDRVLRDDMNSFIHFIRPLQTRQGLLLVFGDRINLSDVCDFIPAICRFYRPEVNITRGPTTPPTSPGGRLRINPDLKCEYVDTLEKISDEGCAICFSDTKCDTILNCGHMFCIDCVVSTVKVALRDRKRMLFCAMCRTETKKIKSTNSVNIDMLVELLN